METIINWRSLCKSFDRCDFTAFNLTGGDEARTDCIAIQKHGAGSAIAGVTADFRACKAQIVAQDAREAACAGDRDLDGATVHRE